MPMWLAAIVRLVLIPAPLALPSDTSRGPPQSRTSLGRDRAYRPGLVRLSSLAGSNPPFLAVVRAPAGSMLMQMA
jgi:hypothetical protein